MIMLTPSLAGSRSHYIWKAPQANLGAHFDYEYISSHLSNDYLILSATKFIVSASGAASDGKVGIMLTQDFFIIKLAGEIISFVTHKTSP